MAIRSVTRGAKAQVEGWLLMRPVGSDPVFPPAGSPGLNRSAAISGSGDRRHNGPIWDAMSASAQLAPWSLRGGGWYAWTSRQVYARSMCATRRSFICPAKRGEIGGISLDPMAYPEPKGFTGTIACQETSGHAQA